VKQILKRLFGGDQIQQVQEPEKKTRTPKVTKSARDLATERGEPWVSVVSVDLDPSNISAGSFELDWNDKFLANLVRAGYQKQANEPDHVIVDRWFQDICRNVVLETYEQEQADPELRRVSKRHLGGGRTEIS
jgi:hypothetical protein